MKFRFDDQPHQVAAIDAVVDLFEGALLPPANIVAGQAPGADGNQGFQLSNQTLAANLKSVTAREDVDTQDTLVLMNEEDLQDNTREFPNFSVEMETGTGKTYVYIATALRLAETYGLRKFVILVHSVAIRAGVLKTFEQTYDHFRSKFPNLSYGWNVMGESRALDDFVDPSSTVQFLVASIQLLDKPDTNTLYFSPEQARIWGEATSGIKKIAQAKPIVLIDEPQNMATPLRKRAIATLNPLVVLRYSATHKETFNLVHRLGAKRAAEIGLVKRVAVKGIVAGSDGQPYLHFKKVVSKSKKLFSTLMIDKATNNSPQRTEIVVSVGDDIYDESGRLEQYRGLVVDNILRKPDRMVFENGLTLSLGEEIGVDQLSTWRDQVRQTIRTHLARQSTLNAAQVDVKVLSLFFVERVADYVGDNAPLPEMFDSIFREEWVRAGGDQDKIPNPAELRVAYFPSTKTGILKDTKGGLASEAEFEARAYKEIIEHKELILDKANPHAFIFSHSALREGWDNPNVFQIGFLRHTRSDTERRQQIGRGLRLPVDQSGNRIVDPSFNRLTLVVDESFAEFREGLNAEYIAAGGKAGTAPDVEDANSEVVIRRRSSMFESPEFAALWNRIRYRAIYRVSVDTPALIAAVSASEHLDDLRFIKARANVVQSAELVYDDNGLVITEDSSVSDGAGEKVLVAGQRLPNVVQLVEDKLLYGKFPLQLTRPTVVAVLQAIPDAFKAAAIHDPDRWARVTAQAIRVVVIEQMVQNITYEPMDEDTWWDANVIFLEVEAKIVPKVEAGKPAPQSGVAPAPDDGLNLFDHVDYDSHVERHFAEQLENDRDRIKLFTKLPRRFKVRTPVGEYSPDWAIVCDESGTERLYLVRETKDTLNLDNLAWDEALRIRFAKKHFAVSPNGEVNFNNTTDKDGLRIGSS
ncbi:DEAD/DEAH box helicase family protein [Acetobacter suratthaniensis]|uniref:DEAD/DEAH box helicase family protein n=1 Tax=Acetobacter suratthaniensis TaxID=1502841 RepID=A0ABS3LPB8_9PROT|nr:DEAD/DEAH box helicase family protein [Acetobacter suratthaniensis]MCX2567278.1 DEAD/DEAH box helicase family protein [Acetobacter suratthaniensis]